jgi:hypothetical protein
MTLDPAVRDLLTAVHLAITWPWSGEETLPERLATVQGAIEDVVRFGDDPAEAARRLQRVVDIANAGRIRRADQLALDDASR